MGIDFPAPGPTTGVSKNPGAPNTCSLPVHEAVVLPVQVARISVSLCVP